LKTSKIILAASLALAALAAAAPAQAATRYVEMGMESFAQRCVDQGGLFEAAVPTLSCQTASVRVDCVYFTSLEAECSWPGIDNRIAVNRLIGMGDATSLNDTGFGKKKGGIKLPDLPLNWK